MMLDPGTSARERNRTLRGWAGLVAVLLAASCQCSDRTIQAYPDQLVGVGVVLRTEPAGFVIGEVVSGGPAAEAGLSAGDHLVEVDGTPTSGRPLASVVDALRGADGSEVVVRVKGARGHELVTITRRPITRAAHGYRAN